jgi:mRNA interferase YafQ
MKKLVLSQKFRRSLRKFVKGNPKLQTQVETSLILLQEDVFTLKLDTHLLRGELAGLYACSCGYDCRIVFSIEDNQIILLDVGSHDEVY